MLNGTATPCRLKRPNLRTGSLTYELPAGLGVFFPTCWTGSETRHHHLENGVCPNCGRATNSERLCSLHAIRQRGNWTTAFVVALDQRWTHLIAAALVDDTFLTRPLSIKIGPGDQVSVAKIGHENINVVDARKAADRIVAVWRHYFQGLLTATPSILHMGPDWRR